MAVIQVTETITFIGSLPPRLYYKFKFGFDMFCKDIVSVYVFYVYIRSAGDSRKQWTRLVDLLLSARNLQLISPLLPQFILQLLEDVEHPLSNQKFNLTHFRSNIGNFSHEGFISIYSIDNWVYILGNHIGLSLVPNLLIIDLVPC